MLFGGSIAEDLTQSSVRGTVPALACVVGNRGVRSPGKAEAAAVPSGGGKVVRDKHHASSLPRPCAPFQLSPVEACMDGEGRSPITKFQCRLNSQPPPEIGSRALIGALTASCLADGRDEALGSARMVLRSFWQPESIGA